MAPKASGPDLTKYMDKHLNVKLNGNRTVSGRLRGFDQFLNLVLEETVEHRRVKEDVDSSKLATEPKLRAKQIAQAPVKIVDSQIGTVVIRGNSVLMIEAQERI